MPIDALLRGCRLWLVGAALAGSATAAAQMPAGPPAPGTSYAAPPVEAAPQEGPASERSRRTRREIVPYLEVAQIVSADLDGGDTLTYTSLAAGVDGRVETRRISVQASYRYQRNIEWSGDVADNEVHSGLALVGAELVPGTLRFDAGALATRTAGEGRAFGISDRDPSIEIYSLFAGPSFSGHAGPVALTANYRLGYVGIDDDSGGDLFGNPIDSVVSHSVSASAGMSPGRLPIGWTVGAGYVRSDSRGALDDELEGLYVRADLVLPVGPDLALTAGVGYENIEASQYAIAVDAQGFPIPGPGGGVVADPSAPRVLTYDLDGIIYDAGLIWRPSQRTELQARAGHRYGGTTFVGSLSHRFSAHSGVSLAVFDTVETFGGLLVNDLSLLPDSVEIVRNPLTGNLGSCQFGSEPGSGACLDRALQSIRGGAFRLRGASLLVNGERGLWTWGIGAGFTHRRYGRIQNPLITLLGTREQSVSLYGSLSRRLSRASELGFDAYASWFDSDDGAFDNVFSIGSSATYSRRLMMSRMRLLASLGLQHSDDGTLDSTVASGLLGLRYSF